MSKKKTVLISMFCSIMALLFIALLYMTIVGVAFKIVYTQSVVEGSSMYPTLNANSEQEIVYINKYKRRNRNDIVVASVDWWDKGPIVKRLVGVPGDKVKIVERVVDENNIYVLIVNGQDVYSRSHTILTQEYVNKFYAYLVSNGFLDLTLELGEDEYFLMGDNWNVSEDCTTHGPISKKDFVGRADYSVDASKNYRWENIKFMFMIPFMV